MSLEHPHKGNKNTTTVTTKCDPAKGQYLRTHPHEMSYGLMRGIADAVDEANAEAFPPHTPSEDLRRDVEANIQICFRVQERQTH